MGFPKTPVKFTVLNITDGGKAKFFFTDVVEDYTLTPDTTEKITIFIDDPTDSWRIGATWSLSFESDTTKPEIIAPEPGDIFRISTKKIFRAGEYFTFSVNGAKYDTERAKSMLDDIYVVPNPYVVANSWEPTSPFRFGRGERIIQFLNLPAKCTIRIYTVRGYLVAEIPHDAAVSGGGEKWNLVSKDEQDIAYGVYIFHVDAPGIGTHIGRFAIIK